MSGTLIQSWMSYSDVDSYYHDYYEIEFELCVLSVGHIIALSRLAGLGQRTSPYIKKNIVSGGKITNPSDLRDGLDTGTYLQRTWAGCHEQ